MSQIINNCFVKSILFSLRKGPLPQPYNYIDPVINKVEEIAKQLQAAGRIRKVINIQNFINLLGKEVEDLTKDLIKYIVELYAGPNRDTETDKEDT